MAILWDWHANSGDPPQAVVDFLEACMKGNTVLLKQALANNVDVNTLHRCGLSGLIIAADSGNADIVEILLDNRVDTCYKWSTKNALYYAEQNKDGRPGDSEEDLAQRKKTYLLLKERTKGEESDTVAPQLRQVGPIAGPKVPTDLTTIVDRIPALISEEEGTDIAWVLHVAGGSGEGTDTYLGLARRWRGKEGTDTYLGLARHLEGREDTGTYLGSLNKLEGGGTDTYLGLASLEGGGALARTWVLHVTGGVGRALTVVCKQL
ncbi:hypothetical protein CYMTET_25896 [Cymbomonas tetramitiformis]|uniref:Uncharacterized protein n=1 Tax=Cymbomonas tetramitiformis TaxID=36881 RepID=A0AAE0FST8_9CHLO|nr:hypothetical protein CYMTET_25896 [Cymbomonas tetramitiformis]